MTDPIEFRRQVDQVVDRLQHIADDGQCDCRICDTAMQAVTVINRLLEVNKQYGTALLALDKKIRTLKETLDA